MSTMATLASPQKITFAEMRESGARGLLVYCADDRYQPKEPQATPESPLGRTNRPIQGMGATTRMP